MSADTIYALSSGRGMAGVAVVRVSGPASRRCLEEIAGGCPSPRRAVLRKLREAAGGDLIDTGLVLWFPAPASFTGEDVAEFHVHGSQAVLAGLFAALNRHARPAEAGEFTRRAFRNGRLDLVEAEGLADLLEARTVRQRRQALHQMSGAASGVFEEWRSELVALLARVEAAVDFAEEEDVATTGLQDISARCRELRRAMASALADAGQGEAVRDGVHVVLAGLPNTGKSSLLNALARRDVAITSPIPGTTRDVVSVEIELAGVPVRISDTAGLREAGGDEIEREGIDRSRRSIAEADLVVWVSSPDVADSALKPAEPATVRVQNKIDLCDPIRCWNEPCFHVSAKTGAGMTEFLLGLALEVERLCGRSETHLIVRARQAHAVAGAISALDRATLEASAPLEVLGEDLRDAARCLGRITGRVDVEDLLDSIFRSFCIGK